MALPRYEALLKEGLSATRALGARDLRWPRPIVMMKPESADLSMPPGKARLALLCGPTAALSANQLSQSAAKLGACALTWCMEVPEAASCSAVCIGLEPATSEPPQKRAKTSGGPEGTVRVRHILFRHPQLRQADPMARREGAARNVLEAELACKQHWGFGLNKPGCPHYPTPWLSCGLVKVIQLNYNAADKLPRAATSDRALSSLPARSERMVSAPSAKRIRVSPPCGLKPELVFKELIVDQVQWNRNDNDKFSAHADTNHNLFVSDTNRIVCYDRDGKYQPLLSGIEPHHIVPNGTADFVVLLRKSDKQKLSKVDAKGHVATILEVGLVASIEGGRGKVISFEVRPPLTPLTIKAWFFESAADMADKAEDPMEVDEEMEATESARKVFEDLLDKAQSLEVKDVSKAKEAYKEIIFKQDVEELRVSDRR
eukprot:g14781.t1